jgi:hypothetical protein
VSVLDKLGPPRGECAFCGHPDARHRLADAIIENVRAGDAEAFVADIYEVPTEAVAALVVYALDRSRQHKARWPS